MKTTGISAHRNSAKEPVRDKVGLENRYTHDHVRDQEASLALASPTRGREAGAEAGCECGEAKPGLICRGELGCEDPEVLYVREGIMLECDNESYGRNVSIISSTFIKNAPV